MPADNIPLFKNIFNADDEEINFVATKVYKDNAGNSINPDVNQFHFTLSVTRFESFQMEDELVAALPIAAAQNFLAAQVGLTIEDVRTRLIGVGHSNHRGGILDLTGGNHAGGGIDVGSIPVGRGRLTDGILAACGQALDLGGLAVFQGDDSAAFELVRIAGVAVDCVGVSAICAVAFQVDLDAELGRGIGAVGRVSLVDLDRKSVV